MWQIKDNGAIKKADRNGKNVKKQPKWLKGIFKGKTVLMRSLHTSFNFMKYYLPLIGSTSYPDMLFVQNTPLEQYTKAGGHNHILEMGDHVSRTLP